MKVNTSEAKTLVKSTKRTPSTGGVTSSVIMLVLVTMFMSVLMSEMEMERRLDSKEKTTTTSALTAGKCLMPAHMAMVMGSVPKVQSCRNCHPTRTMPEGTPEWARKQKLDICGKIDESQREVTSKITNLGQELTEFKQQTGTEITGIQKSLEDLKLEQQSLKEKVDTMEREKSTWEKGVEEDMKKISQGRSVVNLVGPSEEDIAKFRDQYDKMTRSVGLAPFSPEDFERVKSFLREHNHELNTQNILSVALMDFWEMDLGIDKEGVEKLSEDMETCWWTVMPMRHGDTVEQKAIYARFKDESGRLTMYARAKPMNNMTRKHQIEPRRILIDVCPQLERRFGCLKKLERQFREEEERESGSKPQTKITMEDETLYIQYRFEGEMVWRTLDADRHFPKVQIPGVRYRDKLPYAVRPKAYRFQGTRTPPGRSRSNRPMHREQNPPRLSSASITNNNYGAGNNNSSTSNPNHAALARNMSDLNKVPQMASINPSVPSNSSAGNYSFSVDRKFYPKPGSARVRPGEDAQPHKWISGIEERRVITPILTNSKQEVQGQGGGEEPAKDP